MLETYNEVIDINDLCEILHIGRKSAYQLLKHGEIPYKRIGRIYRIRKDAVIEYLKN